MEVNFLACEPPDVNFSTDKGLRVLQAFYTQNFLLGVQPVLIWSLTGFDLVLIWFSTCLAWFELVYLQVLDSGVYKAWLVCRALSVFKMTMSWSQAYKFTSYVA